MSKNTPLHSLHKAANAKLVDFAGWDMPLHYGSQIQEHNQIRENCGMFDVSHMGVLDISGKESKAYLRHVLANDVEKLKTPGQALYSCMLNQAGGVIDDLIVYWLGDNNYRIVLNAGRRDVDLSWLQEQAKAYSVSLDLRHDYCIIAVQGPKAIDKVIAALGDDVQAVRELKPFHSFINAPWHIAKTGYTGEDGVEIILAADDATELWQKLLVQGVPPCGLGARDTLRLEAGLNLYGADMTEQTSPLISNLAWTVSFKDPARDFIGREALALEKNTGIEQKLVGIVMTEKGVLRDHQAIFSDGQKIGEITSGSFSPTLGHAIALVRVENNAYNNVCIDRRGKTISVKIVSLPFVRFGQKVFEE